MAMINVGPAGCDQGQSLAADDLTIRADDLTVRIPEENQYRWSGLHDVGCLSVVTALWGE